MNLKEAAARQPEIIRAVQKDLFYTTELGEDFSDILKIAGPRKWIRYNHLCRLLAEITYHGFASLNNLQTLGEEYTGIIRINSPYTSVPSKLRQIIAILLEFGGDTLYLRILEKLEKDVKNNNDIRLEAKHQILSTLNFMKSVGPYVKGLHKTLFYFHAGKYQISKRFTGINYILIRHWLRPDHSLYGYKILGIITFLQLSVSLLQNIYDTLQAQNKSKLKHEIDLNSIENRRKFHENDTNSRSRQNSVNNLPTCHLCLEIRQNSSATSCGHLFCWECIIDWLEESNECPLCREYVKQSNVVQLRNYSW